MDTAPAVTGFACLHCGESVGTGADARRCPDCGGPLDVRYDYADLDDAREAVERARFDGLARYDPVLPAPADRLVTVGEGATALVDCPGLAEDVGVGSLLVKDEGRNPTGTVRDRAFAVSVTAASDHATDVALPTTGDGGQSAAAYAARAGLGVEAFVPARSTFVAKAMTNVHGGEMSVVEGRYDDAVAAFESATADARESGTAPRSLAPGDTPYRHEGLKTLLWEVVEQLDWTVPDAVVHPTAHGEGATGSHKAARELVELGLVDGLPALSVAQPDACAPVVEAWSSDATAPARWDRPDTLVGALEVPDPALGGPALGAVRETGGRAVAVSDEAALDAAVALAEEGVEASATGGIGAAAARRLAADGHLGADDTVVIVNPVAGNKENDVLRSHLMRAGV